MLRKRQCNGVGGSEKSPMRQGLEHMTVQTLQMLSCDDGNVLQTQVGTSSMGCVAELATKLFPPPLEVSSEPCLSSSGSLNGLVTVVVNGLQEA